MEYIVTADRKTCGKRPGEVITEKEIQTVGGNVRSLLREGKISVKEAPKARKEIKEIKEEPQVQQAEPQAFVFNQVNNEGDK